MFMEWAVNQCNFNAEKLRTNMIESNGTINLYMENCDYAIKFV